MSTQRLHKVLLNTANSVNIFPSAKAADGTALPDPTVAAQSVQPAWPPYTETCLDIHTLNPIQAYGTSMHTSWVLRAELRCCCARDCPQPQDHDVSFAKVQTATPTPGPRQTPHGPGQGYVEATLSRSDLATLAQIGSKCSGDSTARSAEAALLNAAATTFGLTPTDIEHQLGVAGTDANGLLSASGRVPGILAGTLAPTSASDETAANDYYVVACYLNLYQRLVASAHARLTKDWPQRPVMKEIRHAAYPVGGVQ